MRGRVPLRQPEHHHQDHSDGVGPVLAEPHHPGRLGGRARRVDRPRLVLPAVRDQQPDPRHQPFVERDKVDLTQYQAGLADLFVKDGKRYGLPKDWDTMALVYNTALLPKDAPDLTSLTWNPTDGGTFQKLVAMSTVDANGHNGLDPAFDKNHVKVYGFLPEWADGSQGQNGWGDFAVSNGFTFLDKNPWGTQYKF